jgi:uncharacterized membrane protein
MNFYIVSRFFAIFVGCRSAVIFIIIVYVDVVDDGGAVVDGRGIWFVIFVRTGMIQVFCGKEYPIERWQLDANTYLNVRA